MNDMTTFSFMDNLIDSPITNIFKPSEMLLKHKQNMFFIHNFYHEYGKNT